MEKSQLYKPGQRPFEWDPKDLLALEGREIWQISGGVFVGYAGYWNKPFWLRSHKRHAELGDTRAAHNGRWGSYTNNNKLSRTLREQRSLNIPRENYEARNGMIANLERDFAPRNEREAA